METNKKNRLEHGHRVLNECVFVSGHDICECRRRHLTAEQETLLLATLIHEVQEGAGSSKPVDGDDQLDQPVPTGNKDLFSSYKAFNRGNVLFGRNTKSKIIGKGQICDKKCKVLFSETDSEIIKDGITIGKGIRKHGLYIMKMGNSPKDALCLTSIDDSSTLCIEVGSHAALVTYTISFS
ncbi:hypothetical protein Tco_1367823 [Tanacetum coccineum]